MNEINKTLIYVIAALIATAYTFIKGVLDLNKYRNKDESINLYDSIDLIIIGTLFFPIFLFFITFNMKIFAWLTFNRFCIIGLYSLGVNLLILGLFVVINKSKMKNSILIYFGPRKLAMAVVLLVCMSLSVYVRGF
jgi:hypothetical protein